MTGAPQVVIAVDVGSTSARAGVFDAGEGACLGRAGHSFSIGRPLPDHAEHKSDEIWRAVCAAARQAVKAAAIAPQTVAGLAFDATCSLAMFDARGNPVTVSSAGDDGWNVVMWADHRAVTEAEEITATGHRVLDYVGGVMSPEMQLPKLLWLKRHLPNAWRRYGLALDLADFLAWKASGKLAASACTLTCKWTYLNHEETGWQQDLLERVGLGDLPLRGNLPRTAMPIGAPAGTLTAEAAGELGLTERCVVGVGLIDAHAGGVGLLGHLTGDVLDRNVAMIAGTSTCHMAVSAKPRQVAGVWGPYFGAMLPGLWLNEAGQSASGALLDHILDWHAEGRSLGPQRHQRVLARLRELLAAEGPALVGALQVVPDFHGNRSPLANPAATGAISGLTLDHSFDSLARLYYATAIGIALGTRHILDCLDRNGYGIRTIHLTGGHVANPLLVSLYADATGREVLIPKEEDSVLLGTAAVAATAARLYPTLTEAARAMIKPGRSIKPAGASEPFFDRQYRRFLLMLDQQEALRAT
jgi:FGGY-family pentulose kinase